MSNPFLPLKKKYFEEFLSGEKTTEYRRYGGRFREHNFPIGAIVRIGCGYSGPRIHAIIQKVECARLEDIDPSEIASCRELYGDDARILAIHVQAFSYVVRVRRD